jgi:hypothetical protein
MNVAVLVAATALGLGRLATAYLHCGNSDAPPRYGDCKICRLRSRAANQ